MARPSSFDREDALANARNLFWRKGFHATSLKDIEAALSLRPGSIYAAFGSKKDLFAEALKYYSVGVEEEFQSAMACASSPMSGLIAYISAMNPPTDDCTPPSNACMVFKTALELANDSSELKDLARAQMDSMAKLFADAFAKARAQGEISPDTDPMRAALKLQAGITGMRGMVESGLPISDIKNLRDDLITDLQRMRTGS